MFLLAAELDGATSWYIPDQLAAPHDKGIAEGGDLCPLRNT